MGKQSAEVPDAPDPLDIIDASSRINRVNTESPFGSTRFIENFGEGPLTNPEPPGLRVPTQQTQPVTSGGRSANDQAFIDRLAGDQAFLDRHIADVGGIQPQQQIKQTGSNHRLGRPGLPGNGDPENPGTRPRPPGVNPGDRDDQGRPVDPDPIDFDARFP